MRAAQTEANQRWQEKNKERTRYLSHRSRARTFINKHATREDVEEFKELLKAREAALDEMEKE